MSGVSPAAYEDMKEAQSLIFRGMEPTQEPFVADVQSRGLVFPANFQIPRERLAPFTTALTRTGESGFFLSFTEKYSAGARALASDDWWVPLSALEMYVEDLFIPSENMLLSPTGRWGVMFSQEGFGVVGGDHAVVSALTTDLSLSSFLKEWRQNRERGGYETAWVPQIVQHLYGTGADDVLRREWFNRQD